MEYQDSAQPEYYSTRCGACGSRLSDMLTDSVCRSCQSQLPVSKRISVVFETTGAEDSNDGVKVSVGGSVTLFGWRDFETADQLWHRVGELVQLVWNRWPDIADQTDAESDPACEYDSEDSGESRWIGDPCDLGDLPDF